MHFGLALLCALKIEAEPIIKRFGLKPIDSAFDRRLGLQLFANENDQSLCLVYFGKCLISDVDRIGTQIASLATWETIRTIKPAMLASIGTAGGFKSKGANIGDVYISDGPIYFHGRHIPVPAYKDFEIGKFPTASISTNGTIKKGVISSGDSVPLSQHDQEKMLLVGTDAKDMEAAAVAEIAHLASVPMFALKAISDFVDLSEQTHQQFLANYKIATERLTDALEQILASKSFG